jgi:hypothetical protein
MSMLNIINLQCGIVSEDKHSISIGIHSRWLLFFKVMIFSLWNLFQYHSIVRWAIQAQWAEPLVIYTSCFRGEDFFNINQSEKRIILGGHVYRPNGTKWRNFIEDLTSMLTAKLSNSPTLHSRWLLFFKVMIIFLWNLLQYHSIFRWAIQAQWAEPLVFCCTPLPDRGLYSHQWW